MSLNLEKQLRFYGAYHHNPVNVSIHIVCVPAILITILGLLTNTPSVPLPTWLSIPNLPLNIGTFGAFLYCTLYVLMEPVAGGLLTPLVIGGTAYANYLTSSKYASSVNSWAVAINVVSWIAQFIGHGKFEGRAPALFDNLVQALFLAPLFVWLEVLFALGYRPDLKQRIDRAVQQDLKKLREENIKGQNGSVK